MRIDASRFYFYTNPLSTREPHYISYLECTKYLSVKILIASFIYLFSITDNSFERAQVKVDNVFKENVKILFNKNTGFFELIKIKEFCEARHIALNYTKIEYNDNGQLISLKFNVDCNDGFKGSGYTDNLLNRKQFGFYRDYSESSTSKFGILE